MQTSERHRHKRPFQPAITSYFACSADDDITSHSDIDDIPRGAYPHPNSRPQHQAQRLAPHVPARVQTDLLQVGMRVRKSVPEGYKTHRSKMSHTTLPSIQTTLSKPPTYDVKQPSDEQHVHQRELLPFCGLHKIGGYAEQPTTNTHLYLGADARGQRPRNVFPLPAEAFTQPFSSQDSGYGSDIVRSNPSKRSWRDDEGLDISESSFLFSVPGMGVGGGNLVDEVPVSPLSETPEIVPRQFAQPKSRRPAVTRGISGSSAEEDVDMDGDSEARVVVGSVSDFEEADFLAGGEVAMGGV